MAFVLDIGEARRVCRYQHGCNRHPATLDECAILGKTRPDNPTPSGTICSCASVPITSAVQGNVPGHSKYATVPRRILDMCLVNGHCRIWLVVPGVLRENRRSHQYSGPLPGSEQRIRPLDDSTRVKTSNQIVSHLYLIDPHDSSPLQSVPHFC